MAVRNAARFVPLDENVENLHLAGKGSFKTGGVQSIGSLKAPLSAVGSVKGERKKLSNITNRVHSSVSTPAKLVQNLGTQNAGQIKKPLTDKVAPLPSRTPLKNITNENKAVKKNVPTEKKPSVLQQPKPKSDIKQEVDANNEGNAALKRAANIKLPEELEKKVQMWAAEGIEKVHFSGSDMEALRKKMDDEELDKRVSLVLGCRTDFPSFLRPHSDYFEETGDQLKLDPYEEVYEKKMSESIAQYEKILCEADLIKSDYSVDDVLNKTHDELAPLVIPADWQLCVRDEIAY